MPSKLLKYCVEERKTEKEIQEFPEVSPKMLNGKLITLVQVCFRCGKFPFKGGRKRCPHCQGLLRTKTTVLNAP